MPSPVHSREQQVVKLLPIEMPIPIQIWKEELDELEQELFFYQELLQMGLENGSKHIHLVVIPMLEDLSALIQNGLPEMHELINKAAQKANKPNKTFRSFLQKSEELKQDFKQIKAKVFPIISEFQAVTIW